MRAVTVTSDVIEEPELVMNCLLPLTTHSPDAASTSALVRVAPASEPAPGSVRPKAASRCPDDQVRQPGALLLVGAVS